MDQKIKLRRKNSGYYINQDEKEKILMLEKSFEELKEQLVIARTESDAKDELLNKQGKVAQEAIFGWNKAESEVVSLKQQISSLSHQKSQIEQKFAQLKEEKDEISNQTVQNLSKIRDLEEDLIDSSDKVSILTMENKNLYAILETKETIIKELNESNDKASLAEIRARFSTCEKENSNLKYELCMVQKELEIRNKERDYNIKTAEAAYKQQMESLKKVSQLEIECNKLRNMVRKKLPGPNAIAKMRNEVENLGANSQNGTEMRRKKPNQNPLVKKLHVIEEENRVLKETLARKNCDDTMSCAESWASALITELENYKSEKTEGSNSNFGFEGDRFESCPNWLKDIVKVIIEKHYVIQKSVQGIIEEVIVVLKENGFYAKEDEENCKKAPESVEIDLRPLESEENCTDAPETMEITENRLEVDQLGLEANEGNETGNKENNESEKYNEKMIEKEIGENESNLKFQNEGNDEELNNGSLMQNGLEEFKEEKLSSEFEPKSQLESDNMNGSETFISDQDEKQLRTESEIISSTEKLTECQETMLNLNKQLKEISNQKDASISDKMDTSISKLEANKRSFTLYQFIEEENALLQDSNGGTELNGTVPTLLQNSNGGTKTNETMPALLQNSNGGTKTNETVPAQSQNSAELDENMEKDERSVQMVVSKRQKASRSFLGRFFSGKKEKRNEA